MQCSSQCLHKVVCAVSRVCSLQFVQYTVHHCVVYSVCSNTVYSIKWVHYSVFSAFPVLCIQCVRYTVYVVNRVCNKQCVLYTLCAVDIVCSNSVCNKKLCKTHFVQYSGDVSGVFLGAGRWYILIRTYFGWFLITLCCSVPQRKIWPRYLQSYVTKEILCDNLCLSIRVCKKT